jgi:hypothetical protein
MFHLLAREVEQSQGGRYLIGDIGAKFVSLLNLLNLGS